MNRQFLTDQQFLENVGWTLTHSLWQISLIAVMLFCLLRILKNASANFRYLLCLAALLTAILIPTLTFLSFQSNPIVKTEKILKPQENLPGNSISPISENNVIANVAPDSAPIEIAGENPSQGTFESLGIQIENLFNALLPYFIWFWLSGVLIFSLRLCGGIWQVRRFKTREVSAVGEDWQEKFDVLCEITGIRRTIKFLKSELVRTPMVAGWLKPFVIVPSSVLLGLTPPELETIIAHELIHIRRHDYLVNVLQSFVEIILFFHPLAWWISVQTRRERENACDDEVLKIYEREPLLYASALANLEDFRSRISNLAAPNIVAANGGNLMLRIQRIIKKSSEKTRPRQSFWAIIPVFLVISAILATVFLTNGQAVITGENPKTDANKKKIAIGLYSGPTQIDVERSAADDRESMRLLVEKLKEREIPVAGFVKGTTVNTDSEKSVAEQEEIVRLWRDAKFEIGFLDYKSPQSFNSSLNDYLTAIKKLRAQSDLVLSGKEQQKALEQMKKYREEMRKFRDGKKIDEETKANFDKVREVVRKNFEQFKINEKNWKKENNLTAVKYSIGTHDWLYSASYDYARRRNDKESMNRIKTEFIDYMSKILDHYERYSQQLYERNIPQTIALTPSRLTAESAGELFAIMQKRGYEFISMDEAMQDEAYQSDDLFVSGVGSSWFDAVALERRIELLDKPKVDEDVMAIWYK